MVCTTLVVEVIAPVVSVPANTTGFSMDGTYLNSNCKVSLADLSDEVEIKCDIKVENAKAKFDVTVSYKIGTTSYSKVWLAVTAGTGTSSWSFSMAETWVAGTYTVPLVAISNVIAG